MVKAIWRRVVLLCFCVAVFVCVFFYNHADVGEISVDERLLCVSKQDLGPFDDEKVLYIYNWIEYIPTNVIHAFEKITGIKVYVDVFDSNEMLEIKLISNKSRYDLVCPSLMPFFGRQLRVGIYRKLDKALLDALPKFDPFIVDKIKNVDKNAEYCIPYTWGIMGYAVDTSKLDVNNDDIKIGSWDLLLDENVIRKVAAKGNVSFSNSTSEIFSTLAHYMFGDEEIEEEQLEKVALKLKNLSKYIYKFNTQSMNDLFNGSAVVAFGSSSDIRQVMLDSKKDSIESNIKFIFPKEGALLWIDVLAIPKGARHVRNANAFLKFICNPIIMAEISNFTAAANAVPESKKYIMKEIVNDPIIYPTEEMLQKTYLEKIGSMEYERKRAKMFTKIKAGL